MPYDLFVLDSAGNPARSVNGLPIRGAIAGWRGLSFTPCGSAIDSVPQNRVTVPLSDWRNVAVGPGTQIMVYDGDIGDEVTRGPVVGDVQITEDPDGAKWASITFADVLHDLVRADVTTGFATTTGETLGLTVLRLIAQADTHWEGTTDVAGLDGVPFTATGSVIQAFNKLRQERFCHFRREFAAGNRPRIFNLSSFIDPVTKKVRPATAGGTPILIEAPNPNATGGALNPYRRQMLNPQVTRQADVVNSVTPTGGGSGFSQLTLRSIHGQSFTGYNPNYPTHQRISLNPAATYDGYDYYIDDSASVAKYGRTWGTYAKPEITAVVNAAGGVSAVDERTAAASLYVAALADMLNRSTPATHLTFTTDPLLDPRNLGGRSVHVRYEGWAFDPGGNPSEYLHIDDDFVVLSLVVNVSDQTGIATLQWEIASNGQAAASTGGTILGLMDTVTALHAGVQSYPMAVQYPKSQNIGPGSGGVNADLILTIPADNSVVRTHWAIAFLRLEGMVHTRLDDGHTQDVVTMPTPHDIGNADGNPAVKHDVDAVKHDVAQLNITLYGGGVPVNPYDPSTTLHLSTGSPPGSAKTMVTDGVHFWTSDGSFGGRDVQLQSVQLNVSSSHTNTTTGGTGGAVVATTQGRGGTVTATSGGKAGKTIQQTHLATSGFGAAKQVATQELVYRGPAPTGVEVWVDANRVAGPFNTAPAAIDITANIANRQVAHTVRIRSATNGAADLIVDMRMDVAPLGVRPTG